MYNGYTAFYTEISCKIFRTAKDKHLKHPSHCPAALLRRLEPRLVDKVLLRLVAAAAATALPANGPVHNLIITMMRALLNAAARW